MHIGLIPDGNRRWARKNKIPIWRGHENGAENLEKIIRFWSKSDVKYLTIYTFSLKNFKKRSKIEKKFLYRILKKYFEKLLKEDILYKNKIQVKILGKFNLLEDEELVELLIKLQNETKTFKNKFLSFALCYDGREEIVHAIRSLPSKNISESEIKKYLYTKDLPEVDLVIRTGGEKRISGFLLWDISYAEFYFTKKLFPDFKVADFKKAILDFKNRERRFGK